MFKSIYSILSITFLFVGIVLFISKLILSVNLTIFSGILYITFILIGVSFYILQYLSSRNLKKIKAYGICYEPLSVGIFKSSFLHVRGFYTFYIVCEFCNSNQNIQTIKSSLFIIPKENDFIAVSNQKLLFIKQPKVLIYSDTNKTMLDIINS